MKFISCTVFLILTFPLLAIDVTFIEKNRIEQNKAILQRSNSFAVTEDNIIIIVDYKSADIKVYDKSGRLLKVLGKRGMGPNEYGMPMICDYRDSKFALMDFSKYRIFIYKRTGKTDFEMQKDIVSLGMGFDIAVNGDQILMSGYKTDKNGTAYDLYLQDYLKNQTLFLLPVEIKYGFSSYNQYRAEYHRKNDLVAIGVLAYCAWYEDNAYLAWQGDVRIVKKNIKTGATSIFGKKSPDYIKPIASAEMLKAHSERDGDKLTLLQRKMSYVKDIFVGKDFVGLIYGNEDKNSQWQFTIQFYSHEGQFLNENKISGLNPTSGSDIFFFRSDINTLYYLYHTIDDKDLEDIYDIISYKVGK